MKEDMLKIKFESESCVKVKLILMKIILVWKKESIIMEYRVKVFFWNLVGFYVDKEFWNMCFCNYRFIILVKSNKLVLGFSVCGWDLFIIKLLLFLMFLLN